MNWERNEATEEWTAIPTKRANIEPVSPGSPRYDLNPHIDVIAKHHPLYRTVNFDYLIYVEHIDLWIHANHKAPDMLVKYSTTEKAQWQFDVYRGFNRSFFCVVCETTWSFVPPPRVDNDGWRPARPRTSPGGLPRTYPGELPRTYPGD